MWCWWHPLRPAALHDGVQEAFGLLCAQRVAISSKLLLPEGFSCGR